MKLYHGTTARVARKALTDGLEPRIATGARSNWPAFPSHPMLIYMSAAYAPYFAMSAAGLDKAWGIVEIETDVLLQEHMLPDEDFLEQVSRGVKQKGCRGLAQCKSVDSRTRWFRNHIEGFAHHWRDSVNAIGNAAHLGHVPAAAVTRVALYEPRSNQMMTFTVSEPTISVLNYRFCGQRYRALTGWFFGEPLSVAEYDIFPVPRPAHEQAKIADAIAQRSGITVLEQRST